MRRATDVSNALDNLASSEADSIAEKMNTTRRILESVLKIECCYREIEMKGNYSETLLGTLINQVKKHRDDDVQPLFGKLAEILNKYSHDSGKKVDLNEAKTASLLVSAYIKMFSIELG
jgi:hypothetical protein